MAQKQPLVVEGGEVTQILTGDTVHPAALGTGTRDNTRFLRDDGTWQEVAGGGGSLPDSDVPTIFVKAWIGQLAIHEIVDYTDMELDLTHPLLDGLDGNLEVGDLVFLDFSSNFAINGFDDQPAKTGIYEIGSLADNTAVPMTRAPDYLEVQRYTKIKMGECYGVAPFVFDFLYNSQIDTDNNAFVLNHRAALLPFLYSAFTVVMYCLSDVDPPLLMPSPLVEGQVYTGLPDFGDPQRLRIRIGPLNEYDPINITTVGSGIRMHVFPFGIMNPGLGHIEATILSQYEKTTWELAECAVAYEVGGVGREGNTGSASVRYPGENINYNGNLGPTSIYALAVAYDPGSGRPGNPFLSAQAGAAVGPESMALGSAVAIGGSSIASHDGSTVIGNQLASRNVGEFVYNKAYLTAGSGMRRELLRGASIASGGSSEQILFAFALDRGQGKLEMDITVIVDQGTGSEGVLVLNVVADLCYVNGSSHDLQFSVNFKGCQAANRASAAQFRITRIVVYNETSHPLEYQEYGNFSVEVWGVVTAAIAPVDLTAFISVEEAAYQSNESTRNGLALCELVMGQRLPASEAIQAGHYVNIWNDSGTIKVRKADASNLREAHGFVVNDCLTGEHVQIYKSGPNQFLSSLTAGTLYFLGDGGTVTSSVPAGQAGGRLLQELGSAMAAHTLNTEFKDPVVRYA